MKEESVIVLVINMENHWLTNRFSYDLPGLAFHFSVIKLCTIKALARSMKALAMGAWQCNFSAPENTCMQNMLYTYIITRINLILQNIYWNLPLCDAWNISQEEKRNSVMCLPDSSWHLQKKKKLGTSMHGDWTTIISWVSHYTTVKNLTT